MTAAHRVYQNDDVFRVLARHCDKPSLVRLMTIEQKGTIFDTCVKELYREVDYDDIKSMLRDTVCLSFLHQRDWVELMRCSQDDLSTSMQSFI